MMNSALIRIGSCALLVAFVSGGCASSPQMGLRQATADFNAQRYSQSLQKAKQISERAPAGQREDAAYLAGLSAFQLGQMHDAERLFTVASGSSNGQTAANSKAMLGQIRLDQRRPKEAIPLLTDASRTLEGSDAQKAAYSAAIAYQQSGDTASARKWLAIAEGNSAAATPEPAPVSKSASGGSSASLYHRPASQPNAGVGFTLQVGAFNDKKRAMKAAQEASALAKRDGLGTVQILQRKDDRGRAMYVVQFGAFSTRESAAAAKTRLGRSQYIVAVAGAS
jgi:septal ring-binding cell division protein DamX